MSVVLNDAMLRGLEAPAAGRVELSDATVRGLMFRLTADGIATWSARARLPSGKLIRPTIGRYPEIGLAKARRLAQVLIGKMRDGYDPTAEKRRTRAVEAAREALPTVAQRLGEWQ